MQLLQTSNFSMTTFYDKFTLPIVRVYYVQIYDKFVFEKIICSSAHAQNFILPLANVLLDSICLGKFSLLTLQTDIFLLRLRHFFL